MVDAVVLVEALVVVELELCAEAVCVVLEDEAVVRLAYVGFNTCIVEEVDEMLANSMVCLQKLR